MKSDGRVTSTGSEDYGTRMSSFADTTNTYGAHLLVDFSAIEEADRLLEESDAFIQQATNSTMFVLPIVTRVTGGMNKNWRAKRKDSRLMSTFQTLHPRVLEGEKKLRSILGEVVEKKAVLRIQARHLQCRLTSCVKHNRQLLEQSEEPMEELRGVIDSLSSESSVLKEMIEFNKELLRFGHYERILKGQQSSPFGRASVIHQPAYRFRPETQVLSDQDLMTDDMHPDIETRLIVMRKMREQFVQALQSLLELRGGHLVTLQQCEQSLEVIAGILNRSGIASSSSSADDSREAGTRSPSEEVLTEAGMSSLGFDHARCADCSYGCSMTMDCASHLDALQKQVVDANHRLHALVEMRERIIEEADRISEELNAPQSSPPPPAGGGSDSSSAAEQHNSNSSRNT